MVLRLALFALMTLGLLGFGAVTWVSMHPARVPTAEESRPTIAPVFVLTASRQLHAGMLLKPEDLMAKDVSSTGVPDGASIDTPASRNAMMGAMVRHSLAMGDLVRADDIVRPGDHGFLAAVLGAGMRAVTVSVDAVSGTAGLIWPGDRVDLILLQSRNDSSLPAGKRVGAETVLSNVRVIAIDQNLVRGTAPESNPGSRTATLEVSPEQAERVSVAAHIGTLSLTVRSADPGPTDKTTGPAATAPNGSAVTWASDVSPSLNPNVEKTESTVVHVYQGTAGQEFKF